MHFLGTCKLVTCPSSLLLALSASQFLFVIFLSLSVPCLPVTRKLISFVLFGFFVIGLLPYFWTISWPHFPSTIDSSMCFMYCKRGGNSLGFASHLGCWLLVLSSASKNWYKKLPPQPAFWFAPSANQFGLPLLYLSAFHVSRPSSGQFQADL